jgi:hypothetical protein
MPQTDYTRDHRFREELAELLDEHGYTLAGFQLADKEKADDQERTVTVKATRSLRVEQGRLDLHK